MKPVHNLVRLVDCARAAQAAPHGGKEAVYAQFCAELGLSRAALLSQLKRHALGKERKARSDKGAVSLPQTEALAIVRWQRDNARKTGGGRVKNMVALHEAVRILRSNGEIKAQTTCPDTGEIKDHSIASIRRAITVYGLHSDVLDARAPSIEVAAAHPNSEWQIDASICTKYHLPKDGGLQEMKDMVFEKNKPENYKKIELERVWRFVVVCKASHAIYVEYLFGGETGANLAQVLINAMQQRDGEHFWGVPKLLYTDPGAAMTGAVLRQLCASLGIELKWHMPGAARATGSVEKAQDIVERGFESMLKARPIHTLADLNTFATQWRKRFCAQAVHTRHGMTRYGAWSTITTEQLVQAPSVEVCKELATTAPKQCTVTQTLTVRFKGQEYQLDAATFSGVYVGQKVMVTRNAWDTDRINVVDSTHAADAAPHIAMLVERGELGYRVDSHNRGEGYQSHAHTTAQKQIQAMQAADEADNAANPNAAANTSGRRTKQNQPFGGRINPFKPLLETNIPTYMPRVASEIRATPPVAQQPTNTLSLPEACKYIKGVRESRGDTYEPSTYAYLQARYADGRVPQDAAEALAYADASQQATGTHDAASNAIEFTGLRSVK